MILECPSCENRYLVDPRALGKAGRTVRCAKCKHQWFAEPAAREPEEDVLSVEHAAEEQSTPRPIPPGSSVPAIHTPQTSVPQSIQYAAVAMLMLFLASALVYFRPLVVESIPGLKAATPPLACMTRPAWSLLDSNMPRPKVSAKTAIASPAIW